MSSPISDAVPRSLLALLGLCVAACGGDDLAAPTRPPYLAIVSIFGETPEPDIAANFAYRVRELTQLLPLDTTVKAVPSDTVILDVPPSTYRVEMLGLPERCSVRTGTVQDVLLLESTNTGLARYIVTCQPALRIAVLPFGPDTDDDFIYTLTPEGGSPQLGVVEAPDTIAIPALAPGHYTLTLGHVTGSCEVVSNGGVAQRFEVPATGGVFRTFVVACADPAKRPAIALLRGSYHDGAIAWVAKVVDPQRDVSRFYWDISDCEGASVQPGGGIERVLDRGRASLTDTATILTARELTMTPAELVGRCVLLRVTDFEGNTSTVVEAPLQEAGTRPVATSINAFIFNGASLRTTLAVEDSDGDFVGTFVTRRVRDGVLRPPDGGDDFLLANAEGFPGTAVPDLPFGPPYPSITDVNAAFVYVIDRQGNFERYIDVDTFH